VRHDDEGRLDEAGGRVVHDDARALARPVQARGERRRLVEHVGLAARDARIGRVVVGVDDGAPGHDDERRAERVAQVEGASRGLRRLVGRRAARLQGDDEAPAGEHLARRAVARGDRAHLACRALVADRAEHQAHEPALGQRQALARRRGAGARHRALDQVAELVGGLGTVARAVLGLLGHEAREKLVDLRVDADHERRRRRRVFEEDLRQHRGRLVALERVSSGDAAMEQRAEGEDVGRRPDLARPARLLGRHVRRCPDDHSGVRELDVGARAGDAEVDEDDLARVRAGEDDVRRFHVAMHDAARVRVAERVREPHRQGERGRKRQRPALEPAAEGLALDPLHREERIAVRRDAAADVANDVRVIEPAERARLAREALGPVGGARPDDLDGDRRARVVVREVDRAHSPGRGAMVDHESIADARPAVHLRHRTTFRGRQERPAGCVRG
jgi:hypothetical protein